MSDVKKSAEEWIKSNPVSEYLRPGIIIKALLAECERLEAECNIYHAWRNKQIPAWESVCDEWKAKCEKLESERDAWKTAITVLTPNDADFTDDPHACAGYIRTKLNFGITDRFADAGKEMEGSEK